MRLLFFKKFKTLHYLILHTCLLLTALGYCSVASALDAVTFSVDKIEANDWSLHNAKLKITQLDQATPKISLISASLKLPTPFNNISQLNIRCQKFIWRENYINCQQGQGRFNFSDFKTQVFDFSFQVTDKKSQLIIGNLTGFKGEIVLDTQEQAKKWQLRFKATGLNLALFEEFLALDIFSISQGLVDLDIELAGEYEEAQSILVTVLLDQLSMQDKQGRIASEALILKSKLRAKKKAKSWQWQSQIDISSGALYVAPIYLAIDKTHALSLINNGSWWPDMKQLELKNIEFIHTQFFKIQASAAINYQSGLLVESAELALYALQLNPVAAIYLAPFLAAEDIEFHGQLEGNLKLQKNALSEVHLDIHQLTLRDSEQRFYLDQANAKLNWTQQNMDQASFINWQTLQIKAIPFEPGQLDFTLFDRQFTLLQAAKLGVLGGDLFIQKFSFSTTKNNDPVVNFKGRVDHLSLGKLSSALNWEPLTGIMSGYIPAVHYQNKTLSLDGELKMHLFGGQVSINNLASSGMFTNFAQFYMDLEFDNLDLSMITRKFHTGNIEGKLSGVVKNLYLENWQPVSFYAWMGTPEGDNSTHKISQKAVENIASIGGNSATNAISKGFLSLFSSFRYDKLGFGCYLHQGVCQLMGVEAVDNGFYLVKGGGLPRINIIAYNPRLNWSVLLERLRRITTSDEYIIE